MGFFSFGKKEEIEDDPDDDMEELNSLFEYDSSVFQNIDENEDEILTGLNENIRNQLSPDQSDLVQPDSPDRQYPKEAPGTSLNTGSRDGNKEMAFQDENRVAIVLNNKGVVLGRMGKYEESIKAYEQALMIAPDYSSAWNNKGVILSKLGRYAEALDAYNRALQVS
jgi:tetratricopeptide (TPR) repeat protein